MYYIIDPLNLKTQKESNLLKGLLYSGLVRVWRENIPHSLVDKKTRKVFQIKLTNRIILVPPTDGTATPQYYVVSATTCSKGNNVSIYPVISVFNFTENQSVKYSDISHLLLKVQSEHLLPDMISEFVDNIEHGYHISREARHLGVHALNHQNFKLKDSELLYCESSSVMNKMPGIELFDFIEPFFGQNKPDLPCVMRMQLMIEILRAFEKQVYALGIYHGDLKSENMLVDFGIGDNVIPRVFTDDIIKSTKINIIDYDGSYHFGEPITEPVITPSYASPRIRDLIDQRKREHYSQEFLPLPPIKDDKTDLFSIGKIIGLLWNIPFQCTLPSNMRDLHLTSENIHQDFFAHESTWFSVTCLFNILLLVSRMTEPERENRISLQEAIAKTECIIGECFQAHAPEIFGEPELPPPPPAAYDDSSDSEWSDEGETNKLSEVISSLKITPNCVATSFSPFVSVLDSPAAPIMPFSIFGSASPLPVIHEQEDDLQNKLG